MKKLFLVTASLGFEPGDELPEWYTIFAAGEVEVEGEGKYLVNKAAFDLVKAGIDRRGVDIVFDYEHQTIYGGKAPAAGWARDWRWTEGVGIEAKIDWTEEARVYLAKGEYRYYSPVFYVREADNLLVAVHSVALTNAPKTNHLQPLLAKLGAELEEELEESMTLLQMLVAALKMPENSTDDQVVAKIQELNEAADQEPKEVITKAVIEALGIDSNDESTVVASIHALNQTEKTMVPKADFDALKERIDLQDAEALVTKAMGAGKITPDQKEWADEYALRDPSGFETFVTKAPVVIHLDKLPEKDDTPATSLDDAELLKVAKLMDVTVADLKEYGGLE